MITNLGDYQSRHDTTTPFTQYANSGSRRSSYENDLDDGLPDVFKSDLETQRAIRALPSCESIAGPYRKSLRYPGRRAKSTPPVITEEPVFDPSSYGSRLLADPTGQRRPSSDYVCPAIEVSEPQPTPTPEQHPTRIPKAFWKTEPALGGIVSSGGGHEHADRMVVWDEDHDAFHTIVFPTAHPSTRREVLELTRVFDSLFSDTETAASRVSSSAAQGDAMDVLEVMVPQVKAVDAVLHETSRQVATQCSERGTLISKVQKQQERLNAEMLYTIGELGEYIGKMERRQRTQTPEKAQQGEDNTAMQDRLMGMVNSLLGERDALTQRLGQMESQLRATEATVEQLMKDARPNLATTTAVEQPTGASFFQTQAGPPPGLPGQWEPAACSKREVELQEKCVRLEAELRTMEAMIESQAQLEGGMDDQRLELRSMDSTTQKLVAHLDHLKDQKS